MEQVYYCADCCDQHEHKPIVISKKVKEMSREWNQLIAEVEYVERKASERFEQYEELIKYCDEVNQQLPKEMQIPRENNLFLDYEAL